MRQWQCWSHKFTAATAALAWMFIEWFSRGRPTPLGMVSGVVAGLVAITPAAGVVSPVWAFFINLISGAACYFSAMRLKKIFGYDDSLDVFGVHGVGGGIGALLTRIFAAEAFGESRFGKGVDSITEQVFVQMISVVGVMAYSSMLNAGLLRFSDFCCGGLRVSEEQETEGWICHRMANGRITSKEGLNSSVKRVPAQRF